MGKKESNHSGALDDRVSVLCVSAGVGGVDSVSGLVAGGASVLAHSQEVFTEVLENEIGSLCWNFLWNSRFSPHFPFDGQECLGQAFLRVTFN